MEKSSQGYKAMQICFCDSHYNNIMDIQNRLPPYSKVVHPTITVLFSCLMEVNILGKPGFCFHYYCAVYDECKLSDTFWLADRVRVFVHYTISLSSLCKLIWRHWTYKMPVRYILSRVWVRLSIFSRLFIVKVTIYGAVCFQFSHFPCADWENIHFVLLSSSNRKYDILSIV